MPGLVLKDFLNLRKTSRQYALIFLLMIGVTVAMKNPAFISMYVILCSSMMIVSTFSYDEYVKFDMYTCALPVSRKDIVKAKYIVLILLTFIPTVVGTLLSLAVNLFLKADDAMTLILSGFVTGCCFCVMYSLVIPFIYRLGTEKARMIMTGIYFAVFALVFLLISTFLSEDTSGLESIINSTNTLLISAAFAALTVLAVAISYLVSKRVYARKEF